MYLEFNIRCLIRRYCTELFYRDNPLKIVRCQGTFMYDQLGNKYLDCINNVAHGIYSNL